MLLIIIGDVFILISLLITIYIQAIYIHLIHLNNFMKVGIIGYGFVGKALESGQTIKNNVDILKIDPNLNNNIEDLVKFNADICFICVPTFMNARWIQD